MIKQRLALLLGMTVSIGIANANEIVFAHVGYLGGSGSNVTYGVTGGSLHTGTGTSASGILVSFGFENMPGLPAALATDVQAFMTWSVTRATGVTGDVNCTSACTQEMDNGTLSITAATPIGGKSTLLQATFSGSVNAALSTGAMSFDADSTLGNKVVFTSDFFDFSLSKYNGIKYVFNSVLASLARSGTNLQDFAASGYAQFSSDLASSPEPSTLIIGGAGMALLILARLRKRDKTESTSGN